MTFQHDENWLLKFKRNCCYFISGLLVIFLTACGGSSGGGSGSSSGNGTSSSSGSSTSSSSSGSSSGGSGSSARTGQLILPYQGTNVPVTSISYNTGNSNSTLITNSAGQFTYIQGQLLTFTISGNSYSAPGADIISVNDLGNASVTNQLALLLVNFDTDQNVANGIQLSANASNVDANASEADFAKQLYKTLGRAPTPLFTPSLGINTEAPQAESDSAGQSMPFVDIFRTARPFAELSGNAVFDANGWVMEFDSSLNFARTKALQGTRKDAIPSGTYTLLYEGTGTVQLGGPVSNVTNLGSGGGLTFDLNLIESDNPESNALTIVLRDLVPGGDYIKNIQVIMPGGTCSESTDTYNDFLRVESQDDCPAGTTYVSFVDRLTNNRNAIVFNPDYLNLLKNFKVVRMMNIMEASPGRGFCSDSNGILDPVCVAQPILWDDRATMDDSAWGGSSRTEHTEHNGIPVEVVTELANKTGADPWFNMPHSADDNYVSKFAETVFNNLDGERKVYLEYSNEIWNSGFLGFHFMEARGLEEGLGANIPEAFEGTNRDENYFARLRFYSKRAVEMFDIWSGRFGGSSRFVRVLGTSQGDRILSESVLEYNNAAANNKVDALAMAPYFFGCVDNTGSCVNAPKTLSGVITVNDIFDVMDQPFSVDPSALAATLVKINVQANVAVDHGVDLLAYEGGQHLTILGSMGLLPESEKQRLRDLFKAANRDPRMKQRYADLLTGWRAEEGNRSALFALYTLPQTFYRFGNWGIKEHLNEPRSESPKFDASMDFQETVGDCWWVGC